MPLSHRKRVILIIALNLSISYDICWHSHNHINRSLPITLNRAGHNIDFMH